ncbi:MAG: deoxynucleoside kinase [Bacteroidetes bacterium]|nr:deoxynucleoside kinase [Bacteroidota bacterium]
MRYNYIVIEGNIGAGKTSVAEIITAELNGRLVLEEFEDNSFLPKFYSNPERFALPLELSFLADRYQQLISTFSNPDLFKETIISDYSVHKSLIFANINLKKDELFLFSKIYDIILPKIPQPALYIYLHTAIEELQQNILKRGRSYEMDIHPDYLKKLEETYLEFLKKQIGMRVLIIENFKVNKIDQNDYSRRLLGLLDEEHSEGISYISF